MIIDESDAERDSLPRAIALARRTLKIARQNLIWSTAYNFGSLPLAALGYIPPWFAALGMSLSSVAVVVNAMRLLPKRSVFTDRRLEAGGWRLEEESERSEPTDRGL